MGTLTEYNFIVYLCLNKEKGIGIIMKKRVIKWKVFITYFLVLPMFFNVPNVSASNQIVVYKENIELQVGETIKLKLQNTKKGIQWKSENEKVVKVSKNGKVSAVGQGITYVIAKNQKKERRTMVIVKKKEILPEQEKGINFSDIKFYSETFCLENVPEEGDEEICFKISNAWEDRSLDVADGIELYVFNEEVGIYEFIMNYGEDIICILDPKMVRSENIHLKEPLEKGKNYRIIKHIMDENNISLKLYIDFSIGEMKEDFCMDCGICI